MSGDIGPATSVSLTFDNTVTAGNDVIISVGTFDASDAAALVSVTDTITGNTYTTRITPGTRPRLWQMSSRIAAGGGSFQITVTFNASVTGTIGIMEFSGLKTSGTVTASTIAQGSSTAPAVTFTPVAASGECLVIGQTGYDGADTTMVMDAATIAASFTQQLERETNTTQSQNVVSKGNNGTSSTTVGWTLGASRGWSAQAVSYETDSYHVEQEGFRFRNDDGSETTATWLAAQDTDVTQPLSTNTRVRVLLDSTLGDPPASAYRLEYKKSSESVWERIDAAATATLSYGAPGAGAGSTAGGATVSPNYPTAITSRSALILIIGMKPSSANSGSVTTPSGWTLVTSLTGANDGDTGGYTTTLGADTGNCNIYAYRKDTVDGSETGSFAVTLTNNNVSWAVMMRLDSDVECTWSIAGVAGKDTAGGNVSVTFASDPGVLAGDHIIAALVIPTDVTTPAQFSSEAFTQTGITFGAVSEVVEADSSVGNDVGGLICHVHANSGTSSAAPVFTATAGGTTTNVRGPAVFVRIRATANQRIVLAASANVTAGGEATTAQLSAPSGKTTSDFVTGRMWDDENGTDTIDITTDDYTEVEWCLKAQSPAVNGDIYNLRVTEAGTAISAYPTSPDWTIGTAGAGATYWPGLLLLGAGG